MSTKKPPRLTPLAGVIAYFVGPTDKKPPRWAVVIRDYPTRYYEQDDKLGIDPQHYAELRLSELGLDWRLTGMTYIDKVGYVFTQH